MHAAHYVSLASAVSPRSRVAHLPLNSLLRYRVQLCLIPVTGFDSWRRQLSVLVDKHIVWYVRLVFELIVQRTGRARQLVLDISPRPVFQIQ